MRPRPQVDFEVEFDPEQVAFFRDNGYLAIDRITTDEEIEWVRECFDQVFEERGTFKGGYFDLSRPYESEGTDLLPQVLGPEHRIPELKSTAYFRNGRKLAAQLLGEKLEDVKGWGHMILKPARIGHETPWHQDEAYWDPAFDYCALGVWTSLDPVSVESGCMQFIPGSHQQGVRTHRHIGDDSRVHGLVTDGVDASLARAVPIPVGGATFHHRRTLHHTAANTTEGPRRAYANAFQIAPVRRQTAASRPWYDEGRAAHQARSIFQEDSDVVE